jgi:hypothetical protein
MAIHDYLPMLARPKPPRFVNEQGQRVHGVVAEFPDPATVYHAAEKVRDAGYRQWDVFCPFPMHGLDEAMGVKRTKLPLLVAASGFTGVGLAILMQWWMNYVDFALPVQGKPFNAWEPLVPVTFELGILFAAISCLVGMLAMNGLPRWNHPLFASERFLKVSDDRFIIAIEAEDPAFDPRRTRDLLESLGGRQIALVTEQ